MRAPARLLPALTALALTGTLLGAGAAAADLRADERRVQDERRRIAAAEAEARAVQEYRTTLAALSEELYDAVQPLQSAIERVAAVEDGSFTVLADVSTSGGSRDALKALREEVDTVPVPASLSEGHVAFRGGLDALLRGTELLDEAVDPDLADEDFSRALVKADDALDGGTGLWNRELADLFPSGGAPVTATASGPRTAPRAPASKAGYLEAVGGLCVSAGFDDGDDSAALRNTATALSGLLASLREVPPPAADESALAGSVREHLDRAEEAAGGLDAVAAAIDAGDQRALAAGDLRVQRGLLAMQRAAEGFAAYGSQSCSLALSTDEEAEEEVARPT